MKTTTAIVFFMFFGLVLSAQLKPETVVIEMPVITISVCKKEVREQFIRKLDKLKTELEEEITLRKSKTKENVG
jgi:undecaprenyl pyrophosphate synthase